MGTFAAGMNKKICLLLLPFFALLLSFSGKVSGIALQTADQSWFSLSGYTADQKSSPIPVAHNNEHRKIKNVIRIKAWDDHGAAAILTDPFVFKAKQFYYTQNYCLHKYKHTPFRYLCRYNLRGPPAANNS